MKKGRQKKARRSTARGRGPVLSEAPAPPPGSSSSPPPTAEELIERARASALVTPPVAILLFGGEPSCGCDPKKPEACSHLPVTAISPEPEQLSTEREWLHNAEQAIRAGTLPRTKGLPRSPEILRRARRALEELRGAKGPAVRRPVYDPVSVRLAYDALVRKLGKSAAACRRLVEELHVSERTIRTLVDQGRRPPGSK